MTESRGTFGLFPCFLWNLLDAGPAKPDIGGKEAVIDAGSKE
jgi:hypothetical protein